MGMYNDQLLFIHVPKTGGWSCKVWLKEHVPGMLGPHDPESRLPIGHVRLADIERFTGRAPNSFEKIIAVVRDPYEQQLSQWLFWRDRYARGQNHPHDLCAARHAHLESFLEDPECDFHVWYEQHHGFHPGMTPAGQRAVRTLPARPEGENRYEDFGGIYLFWLSVEGTIPENVEILRLETLVERWPHAVADFVPAEIRDNLPPLKQLNQTAWTRESLWEYYTPRAAQLVEQKAAWAFREFYPKRLFSDFANG